MECPFCVGTAHRIRTADNLKIRVIRCVFIQYNNLNSIKLL